MFYVKNGSMKIVDNNGIKEISCKSIDNTYLEIRLQNGSLDVRGSEEYGGSMRMLYTQKVEGDISTDEMLMRAGIMFE